MYECNETITVFNRRYDNDSGLDVWTPTVISGASWYEKTDTAITDSGLKAAKKCIVRIPEDADTGDKSYVDPITYAGDQATFTLTAGDIIVRGVCSVYAEIKQHSHVTIIGVTNNMHRPRGKHFRVVCE